MYYSSASKVEKMIAMQKKLAARKKKLFGALAASRCTHFLIGWLKRSGSMILFVFPPNNKEQTDL